MGMITKNKGGNKKLSPKRMACGTFISCGKAEYLARIRVIKKRYPNN